MRTLTININRRCPLACRHCSVGFTKDNRGDTWTIPPDDLIAVVNAAESGPYQMILLAGGEPSLNPELIRTAVDACARAGLVSAVVSAPVWARTDDAARRFVTRIAGLNLLILSYDTYHLESLTTGHYRRAAAAASPSMFVTAQIAFTTDEEREAHARVLSGIPGIRHINAMRTVRVGNASDPRSVADEGWRIDGPEDLDRIPRGCVAGNALVDDAFAVHGCCWSSTAPGSPVTITGSRASLRQSIDALEGRAEYQTLRTIGFLGSLDTAARASLAAAVKGRRFSSECDICIAAMAARPPGVWQSCASAASRGTAG